MTALFLALILCLLADFGGRSPRSFALLRQRTAMPLAVTLAMVLATGANAGIAAFIGYWMTPGLTPEARALIFALASFWVGGGLLFGGGKKDSAPDGKPLSGGGIGAFLVALSGLFVVGLSEGAVLLVAGVALARANPVLAGVGGWLGMAGAAMLVALLAENGMDYSRVRAARMVPGMLFVLIGFVVAVGALRLV